MPSEVISDVSADQFKVADTVFRLHRFSQEGDIKTDDESVVILKSPKFLAKYDPIFRSLPSRNVVEVGIMEGGSIIYFALAFPNLKFVGIDLRRENPAVLRHIDRLGLSDRIKLYYGVSQDDRRKIEKIVFDNFGEQPLGAVMDDASHFYEPSKVTFELLYPLIAPGGVYCLEDWAWAHQPGKTQTATWINQPSLANLLFEIILMQPSNGDLIRRIDVDRNLAFIFKGISDVKSIDVGKMYLSRNRKMNLL